MTAYAVHAPHYIVRPLQPDELPLVLSSWLRTLRQDQKRHGDDMGPCRCLRCRVSVTPPEAFYEAERARAYHLLSNRQTYAAVLPDVQDEVLGWACTEPGVLHYVYVKAWSRDAGVARSLLQAAGLVQVDEAGRAHGAYQVSTLTADVLRWIRAGKAITYNPYAALR